MRTRPGPPSSYSARIPKPRPPSPVGAVPNVNRIGIGHADSSASRNAASRGLSTRYPRARPRTKPFAFGSFSRGASQSRTFASFASSPSDSSRTRSHSAELTFAIRCESASHSSSPADFATSARGAYGAIFSPCAASSVSAMRHCPKSLGWMRSPENTSSPSTRHFDIRSKSSTNGIPSVSATARISSATRRQYSALPLSGRAVPDPDSLYGVGTRTINFAPRDTMRLHIAA